MFFLLCFLIGILAGFLAGLFGIGGGTLLVPGLLAVFAYVGLPTNLRMHMATSTALASMIVTALLAVIHQQRSLSINWPLFRQLAPGIIIGMGAGALIALLLSTQALKFLFSLLLLFIALKILLDKKGIKEELVAKTNTFLKGLFGFLIGIVSGLLGIGGGAISVPLFLRLGLPAHNAIATSSACVLLLAITGAIIFSLTGLHVKNLPTGSSGFIYWPAVIAISIGGLLTVPLGTRLGKRLSANHLKKLFALLLIVISIIMLIP